MAFEDTHCIATIGSLEMQRVDIQLGIGVEASDRNRALRDGSCRRAGDLSQCLVTALGQVAGSLENPQRNNT